MKKMDNKSNEEATEIILQDREVEVLIRQLLLKAKERGYVIANLNKAITQTWQEELSQHAVRLDKVTSSEEKQFSEKVCKFLEHYRDALVKRANQTRTLKIETEDTINRLMDSYYYILTSIYTVLYTEASVTQEKLKEVSKSRNKYTQSTVFSYGFCIKSLYAFFYADLCLTSNSKLPLYRGDYVGFSENISQNRNFRNFKSQFAHDMRRLSQLSEVAIWVIDTYF